MRLRNGLLASVMMNFFPFQAWLLKARYRLSGLNNITEYIIFASEDSRFTSLIFVVKTHDVVHLRRGIWSLDMLSWQQEVLHFSINSPLPSI